MKEIFRITALEQQKMKGPLMLQLLGKNIINNRKVKRQDDIANGDIVFYEEQQANNSLNVLV